MVDEAYLACGAADALMNWGLPRDQLNAYRREYDMHHARAQLLINEALDEFRRAGEERRERDVLLLYYTRHTRSKRFIYNINVYTFYYLLSI